MKLKLRLIAQNSKFCRLIPIAVSSSMHAWSSYWGWLYLPSWLYLNWDKFTKLSLSNNLFLISLKFNGTKFISPLFGTAEHKYGANTTINNIKFLIETGAHDIFHSSLLMSCWKKTGHFWRHLFPLNESHWFRNNYQVLSIWNSEMTDLMISQWIIDLLSIEIMNNRLHYFFQWESTIYSLCCQCQIIQYLSNLCQRL